VQQHLVDAEVVKAFNNIFFKHLGSLHCKAGAADRSTLLIAGDDQAAKLAVTDFIDAIGYDVFDTGVLADSWRFERDQPAYASAYAVDGDFDRPKRADRADFQALQEQADPSIR
jgi:predicted dinucleotide-binding enzyme